VEAAPLFVMEDDVPPGRVVESAGWLALGIGFGLATLTELLPFLRVLVGYFVVLVHELGHTLAGWLLGYPSIPAFDFTYGGGVTLRQDQNLLLVAAVYAVLALLVFVFRANRVSLGLVVALALAYSAVLLTGANEIVIIAMGHGGELAFAALFLHRAVSGRACHHAAERALYAWIGFHIVFHDMRFAAGLMSSAFQREMYEEAKGGGHWMDFSQLAEQHFHISLESVAAVFLFLCLFPPVIGLAITWLRPELALLRERLGEI
jgi:hypothetical protein